MQHMYVEYGQYITCECKEEEEEEEINQINQPTNDEQYNKLVNLDDEELKSLEPFLTFLNKKYTEVSHEFNHLGDQMNVIYCYKELLKTRIRQTELKTENNRYSTRISLQPATPYSTNKLKEKMLEVLNTPTPCETIKIYLFNRNEIKANS
jgi:hypothetical protein